MEYNRPRYELFEILFIIFLALLLAMFFYAMRFTLIPPLLALILIAILAPLKNPVARSLLIVVIVVFLFWFIRDTLDILTPFAIAFGLAYLFHPLVTKLERRNVPRLLSVPSSSFSASAPSS